MIGEASQLAAIPLRRDGEAHNTPEHFQRSFSPPQTLITMMGLIIDGSGKGPTRPWKIFAGLARTVSRAASNDRGVPSSWVTYHSPEIARPPAQKI